MTDAVLGLDTSNYRTSVAVVSLEGEIILNLRRLLTVSRGERGLRQSDALYAHLKQLKTILREEAPLPADVRLRAVCASTAPRDRNDSYMPVFEAGDTVGRSVAWAMGIPFFQTDHQHGHLRAARYGTELEYRDRILALHLSGGTTDLLDAEGVTIRGIGCSLDLHAGQLMDRIGVALGCSFPAGPEMEALARRGTGGGRLGCAMEQENLCCHLSGAETRALQWIREGTLPREEIAREVFDLLARTSLRMLKAGAATTGAREALVFGGIASSGLFRELLLRRAEKEGKTPAIFFGAPELSGDNAVGAALIGADRLRKRGTDGCENSGWTDHV